MAIFFTWLYKNKGADPVFMVINPKDISPVFVKAIVKMLSV